VKSANREYPGAAGNEAPSEIRIDLSAALVDGGGTTRHLAQRTGWSVGLTREALNNMVKAGDAAKPHTVRVPGVKRPVPWYVRAQRPMNQRPTTSPTSA